MSEDLIFGVKLDGSGTLPDVARSARNEIDALKKSTGELAAAQQTNWAEVQRTANARAAAWREGNAAADAAADKAWALANGYKEVGGQIVKAGKESTREIAEVGFATARARQEMMVLGREAMSGNFSRMPTTLSIIAQGLSPVALGVAAVTTAVAAGAYAWWNWGDNAEEALKKATAIRKAAESAADKAAGGVNKTDSEKLADLQSKITRAEIELQTALDRNAAVTARTSAYESQEIGREIEAKRNELGSYQRQVDQLQASMAEKEAKAADKQQKIADATLKYQTELIVGKAKAEQDAAEATLKYETDLVLHRAKLEEIQNERFTALRQAAEDADATDAQREQNHLARQLAALEQERMIMATNHSLSEAEVQRFEQAKLDIERIAAAKKEQLGKAMFIQDLATLGKQSQAFMTLYKIAAVSEIMAAGAKRAENSAAWASTWGGYPASLAASALSWAATLANAAMVSGLAGGGSGGGGGGGGNIPMPASPLPETINGPQTPSQPQNQTTIYLMGNVLTEDWINQYITPNVTDDIRDQISNSDVVIIDPRSRQAQMLAGA